MASFSFYNTERPHQALGYQTPDHIYSTAQGGGALIIDKFPKNLMNKEKQNDVQPI